MKTLKRTLLSFLILLTFFLSTLLCLWIFPGILINNKNYFRFVAPVLEKKGIPISLPNLEINASSHSFWKKQVTVESTNTCFQLGAEEERSCLTQLSLNVIFDLTSFKLQEIEISDFQMIGEELFLNVVSEEKSEEATSYNPWPLLKKLRLGNIKVELPELTLKFQEDTLRGSFQLHNGNTAFSCTGVITSTTKKTFRTLSLEVSRGELRELTDLLKLQKARAEINISPDESASVVLRRDGEEESFTRYLLDFAYLTKTTKVRLASTFLHSGRELSADFSGDLRLPQLLRGPLTLKKCKLFTVFSDTSIPIERAELECYPEILTGHLMKDHSYLKYLPSKIDMKLLAKAAQEKNGDTAELKGGVRLEVGPISNSLLDGRMVGTYDINFSRDDEESRIDFDPILVDAKIKILSFRNFARLLNSFSLIVPSPLNVMNGSVRIDAKGELHPTPFSAELSVGLTTQLKGKVQALDLSADGKAHFKACTPPEDRASLFVDLVATQMKLKLPDLNYLKPPTLLPDKRFQFKTLPKKTKERCGFNYIFKFENRTQPILILADFLKNDLPLMLKLQAESEKNPVGQLEITNYSTEFFKRKATVEKFSIDFNSKEVNAKVRVDYADYKIFILLSGHTQSLRLTLQSEPAMAREEVLSVLLFGKTLEGLEPDETGSVRDADAAAKDGALSLASLYIFASTPIESVGYNPHTKGLVTKVKLADGTSLNVGANSQGLTEVGLTRRLSKHWRLQTTLQEPDEDKNSNRSASTMLEWFMRF